MKIRFYGRLGEQLGREVQFDMPAGTETVALLRQALAEQFPAVSSELLGPSRACIADSFVNEGHRISAMDTVEFLPVVSGG